MKSTVFIMKSEPARNSRARRDLKAIDVVSCGTEVGRSRESKDIINNYNQRVLMSLLQRGQLLLPLLIHYTMHSV